ncbi:uncharacterized protein [Pyxicephalus adspersus]|uniref:uncharacterized protein n=1 Tax=Pyxicephalus adspersus TaxID=30357 RepID=UPI003B5925CE
MTAKILIVFYIYLHGVIAREFVQKFSHVKFVKAGETATILCNKTKDNSYATWQWYKEKEDGGLQDVAQNTCPPRPSPLERIVPNCKEKQFAMDIKNVDRSDSGVYYCSETGLIQNFYVANTLIVTEPEPKDPTLSILVPVAQLNAQPGTTILLCIALNWSNKWSLLMWSIDGKESDGWLTLDLDGSLKNLIFLQTSTDGKEVMCYTKNLHESRNISAHLSTESKPLDDGQSPCYIVLYVGIGFMVLVLVIHQIILAKIRGSLCKIHPKKQTRPERNVRFSPDDNTIVYAAVKG